MTDPNPTFAAPGSLKALLEMRALPEYFAAVYCSSLLRLAAIIASARRAKTIMQDLPREVVEMFSFALMTPYTFQMIAGLEGRTRPVFNVTISNVPGPREPLYLRGSRLEAMFPVSAVTHGQALNITCYSYSGTLSFGFAGCRDTLPHMQRLAVHTGEALAELEAAVLGRCNEPAVPGAEVVSAKPANKKTDRVVSL